MVRCSIPASVHIVTIREQRILFLDSKLFPLVQFVICMDVRFQHYPLETVFPVFSYRGVKDAVVKNIPRVSKMMIPAFFDTDGRLSDVSLLVSRTPDSIYDSVYYLAFLIFHRPFRLFPSEFQVPLIL